MKSFFRFLARNPLYAIINMAGLAVSVMFVILIGDYAWRQYSLDRWQYNHDRIVLMGTYSNFAGWEDVALNVKARIPEVEDVCNIKTIRARIAAGDRIYEDPEDNMGSVMLADTNFFRFFDYRIVSGDAVSPLSSPDRCVISESLAQVLFPDGDALGKALTIAGEGGVSVSNQNCYDSTLVYTVSAIMKDFDNTVLNNDTKLVVSYERHPEIVGYDNYVGLVAWDSGGPTRSFLLLAPDVDLDSVKDKISDVVYGMLNKGYLDVNGGVSFSRLDDLMFAPENSGLGLLTGDRGFLNIMLAAAIAILFFAVTNYINLTVANSGFRAKEMATRRLLGSSAASVAAKMVLESVLMVAVAALVAVLLAFAFEDSFENLLNGKISLGADLNVASIGVYLLFIVFLGVVSGILPSIQIARFKPIDVVRGSFRYHSKMVLGKIFIALQNVITLTMLTATLVIILQIRYLVNSPLGYDSRDLVMVSLYEDSYLAADKLRALPCVKEMSFSSASSLCGGSMSSITLPDKDDNYVNCYIMNVDSSFIRNLGIKVIQSFDDVGADGYYVNEEFLRRFGIAVDSVAIVPAMNVPIAGVVGDFKIGNALSETEPCVIISGIDNASQASYIWVRTDGSDSALEKIREAVESSVELSYDVDMAVESVDRIMEESFSEERDLLKMMSVFTAVALVISVLGYVGMSLFFVRQRRKEMGIRRIFGAGSGEVTALMMIRFCLPVMFSFLAAFPLSGWLMRRWLEDFSTHIDLGAWIFALAAIVSLAIAVASAGLQIIHAVRSNPAESVRSE